MRSVEESHLLHVSSPSQPSDFSALSALYWSTGGGAGNWTNTEGWMSGLPCTKRWHGVDCSRGNEVIGLRPGVELIEEVSKEILFWVIMIAKICLPTENKTIGVQLECNLNANH